MNERSPSSLLAAVRRRLWRERFMSASRLALWASAALVSAAAAVHVLLVPVPVRTLTVATALLWVLAFTRAALQRPTTAACALWADRFLAGESAYATLLETDAGAPDAPALRWLESWVSERVPQSRKLLEERRLHVALVRPFAVAVVCGVVAAVVLSIPGLGRSAAPEAVTGSARAPGGRAPPVSSPASEPAAADQLAQALRSAASQTGPDRGSMGPTEGPARDRREAGLTATETAVAPPPASAGRQPATAGSSGANGSPAGSQVQSTGAGSGREAGESRDSATARRGTRPWQGRTEVQRRDFAGRGSATERQVDMSQQAMFDESLATTGMPTALASSAAAAAPAAESGMASLTPAEAAYVKAWLIAGGAHR